MGICHQFLVSISPSPSEPSFEQCNEKLPSSDELLSFFSYENFQSWKKFLLYENFRTIIHVR